MGVRVESVDKGSPASGVIQPEDFLVKLNDMSVRDSDTFVRMVGCASVDQPAQLLVYRGGKAQTLSIALAKRQVVASGVNRENRRIRWEGLLLGPVPRNWKPGHKEREGDRGLVVLAVNEKSRYARQGVREGDIITAIAGKALSDVTDLQQALNDLPPTKRDLTLVSRKGALASIHD
jgi:S1-C subfamily serine protease